MLCRAELVVTVLAVVVALFAAASAHAAAFTGAPDDPLAQLYGWNEQGDGPMGLASAWSQTTGGPVTVAVLDTGIDLTHPDLQGNLWSQNGVNGWNLVANDADVQDDNGHGTHVAGIIGAVGDNGVGVAGIDWSVELMAVKVLDANASGEPDTVAGGIRYAVSHGARILNLSLATPIGSSALRSALSYAQSAGALVVTAAGNWGENLQTDPEYPASYDAPNVISVAATGRSGELDPLSDFGSGVDIAAPGDAIVSTALGGGYELRSGTSMATAEVSGVAALVESEHPTWQWPELRAAILDSARRTTLDVAGGAALNAGAAVAWVPPANFDARLVPATVKRTTVKRTTVRRATAKRTRKAPKRSRRHTARG